MCAAYGQEVSVKKTEVMVVQPKGVRVQDPVITIDGVALKVVTGFKYVGSTETTQASMAVEVGIRTDKMKAAFASQEYAVFDNPHVKRRLKLRLFNTMVLPNGLYNAEAWNYLEFQLRKLDTWMFFKLRRIMGYKWTDYMSWEALIKEAAVLGVKIMPISILIAKRQLSYLGHVLRRDDECIQKIVMHAELEHGERSAGKPENAWRHCVKRNLKKFRMRADKVGLMLAQNRQEWRTAVAKGCESYLAEWLAKKKTASAKSKESKARRLVAARGDGGGEEGILGGAGREPGGGEAVVEVAGGVADAAAGRTKKQERVYSGAIFQKFEDKLAKEPFRVASRRGRKEKCREDYSEKANRLRFVPSRLARILAEERKRVLA